MVLKSLPPLYGFNVVCGLVSYVCTNVEANCQGHFPKNMFSANNRRGEFVGV